jgi:hypothetical protein
MVEILKTIYNKDLSANRKLFFWMLVMIFCYLSAGWIEKAYWKYWPFQVLEIHSFKILNSGKIVYPGGVVQQEVIYSKHLDIQATVYTELENSVLITMAPTFPPEKEIGLNKKALPVLEMPSFAPAGKYTMKKTWCYPIGPYGRTEKVSKRSEPFYVVEAPKQVGPKGEPGKPGLPGRDFWGNRK